MAAANIKAKIGSPVFKEDESKPKLSLVVVDPRYTYDKRGNVLKFDDGNFWYKRTLDGEGRELRLENSKGFWVNTTYDKLGNVLTEQNCNGYKSEYTRDDQGRELTFKNNRGRYAKYLRDDQGDLIRIVRVAI